MDLDLKDEVIKMSEEYTDQVEGRNSVLELLETGKDINKIYIQAGEKHGSIYKIKGGKENAHGSF